MYSNLYMFIFLFCSIATLEITPQVQISLGKIEGFVEKSNSGRKFNSFNGIPYAEPPIGRDRFKEPIPRKPWSGVLKANTKYECLQYSDTARALDLTKLIHGSEDCLYLNIYTPNLNGNLDVLVFIHGGAFSMGSASKELPYILMDRDVVVVAMNYRLGVIGFLSTEDDILPGNNGIKDQILALKWIKDNIQYFGGNPNSITISGVSAGGASTHIHTLSPKSKGLFHKAVSVSSCMLNPWTLMKNPLDRAKELATFVGCGTEDVKNMVDCLSERSGQQIVSAVYKFHPWEFTPFAPFAPVVDTWSSDPVLPEHPYKLLKDKKINDVPWMLGHMAREGLCNGFSYHSEETLEYLDQHWNELMPHVLHYNFTVKHTDFKTVGERMRKEYMGNNPVTLKSLDKLVDLIGDKLFNADFDKCIRLHSAAVTSPVYNYQFSYRGSHSQSEISSKTTIDLGASHGDDQFYLVGSSVFDPLSTREDKAMSKVMVDMYVSFASTGSPKVNDLNWTPVSKNEDDQIRYLKIDSPSSIADAETTGFGNRKFWDSLPFEENEKLFKMKT